jgi:hypothetical protein
VKLTRRAEGAGELEVYFDSAIPLEEKIIFSRYVHEHPLQKDTILFGYGTMFVHIAARRLATGNL